MNITVFCQTNATQSQRPGAAVRTIRLVAVPGAQGPNAASFVDGMGNGFVELQNVTDAIAAQFEAGKSYNVTISATAS